MIDACKIAICSDLSYIWVQDEETAVDLYVLLQTINDEMWFNFLHDKIDMVSVISTIIIS